MLEDPVVFGGDLGFHVTPQGGWEDAPGVGFDFEMGADAGMVGAPLQGIGSVAAGGAQGRGGIGIQRDVKMDAPFAGRDFPGRGVEGIGEIDVAAEPAIRVAGDDLVEIGRLIEGTDGGDGAGVAWVDGDGGGEMDF